MKHKHLKEDIDNSIVSGKTEIFRVFSGYNKLSKKKKHNALTLLIKWAIIELEKLNGDK